MQDVIKKVFHLIISRGINTLSGILLFVFASRYLSLEEYATFRQSFLPVDTLLPILSLGIPETIYYILSKHYDKRAVIYDSLLLIFIMSFLFGLFLILGGATFISYNFNNPLITKSIPWVILYVMIYLPSQLLIAFNIFNNNTKLVSFITSLSSLIVILTAIIYLSNEPRYIGIVIIKSVVPIISLVYLIIFSQISLMRERINHYKMFFYAKDILRTSIPFGIGSILSGISIQIDKLYVATLTTPESYAIYANGAIEIPLIGVITGSISSVLVSDMSLKIQNGDIIGAKKLFETAASKSALFLFPLLIFFAINAKSFMILLYSEKYIDSFIPFRILLLLLPIRIVVFGSALIALGKSKVILKRGFFELIFNIILSYILFKLIGVNGVALSTVIVTYLWTVPLNLKEIATGFNVPYIDLFNLKVLSKIMLICISLSPIIIIINHLNLNNNIYLISSFIIYSLCVLYFYKRNEYLNFVNPIKFGK